MSFSHINHLTLVYLSRLHQPFLSHYVFKAMLHRPWVSHFFEFDAIYNGLLFLLQYVVPSDSFLCLRPMGWRHICFRPVRVTVHTSVHLFFSAAIINEPLDGFMMAPECNVYIKTILVHNLYWIDILTSIFLNFFPEVTTQNLKLLIVAENCR